ncbi:unnamed protein product [Rhizophagus irregularis]|nr:unnamed protein product [Rhizophagus irregularis]CAB4393455.1 unnamed protein product [Rhizophagus irregularis]
MTNMDNGDTQIIRMIDDKKMKMIMNKFKYCTEEIQIKHSNMVIEHVEEVKKLYGIFQKFVKNSLDFNKRLENYSLKNHKLAKDLENKLFLDEGDGGIIKGLKNFLNRIFGDKRIMNELIKIQNSLRNFENVIASDERALVSYKGDTFYAVYFFVISNLAKFTKMKVCEEAVRETEKWIEEKKKEIKSQLNNKRSELNMINLFDDNLKAIISGIGSIKTFWGIQIENIEYITKNLEKFGEGQSIQRRRIVHILEQKWKNVERECQIYNKAMNDVLNNDRIK